MIKHLIGVRAHDYGRDTASGLLTRIANDGWQAVQLAMPKALQNVNGWNGVTADAVEEARAALVQSGVSLAVLGVYIDPSLVNEQARRDNVAIFMRELSTAKTLNAGCIGTETTNMASQPGVTRAEALDALRKSLSEILPEAERLGVTVGIEPVFYHAMATPEDTRAVLADMRSSALRVIFDPGNLYSPEEAPCQHALWQRAFDAFGDAIAAVHIKGVRQENGKMCSCSFADSELDYAGIFRLLRQASVQPPILREEAAPARAQEDRAFLAGLLGGDA